MTYPYEEFGQDRREIEALQRRLEAEIARLQEAKRHFSALADAKGKENVSLRLENERLRTGIQNFIDGDYEPRVKKIDKCPHGLYGYEECGSCASEHFERLLEPQ